MTNTVSSGTLNPTQLQLICVLLRLPDFGENWSIFSVCTGFFLGGGRSNKIIWGEYPDQDTGSIVTRVSLYLV